MWILWGRVVLRLLGQSRRYVEWSTDANKVISISQLQVLSRSLLSLNKLSSQFLFPNFIHTVISFPSVNTEKNIHTAELSLHYLSKHDSLNRFTSRRCRELYGEAGSACHCRRQASNCSVIFTLVWFYILL